MEHETTRKGKARIAILIEEIDSIHSANKLYWERKAPSREARAKYQHRQDRLEEVRSELAELTGVRKQGPPRPRSPRSSPPGLTRTKLCSSTLSFATLCPSIGKSKSRVRRERGILAGRVDVALANVRTALIAFSPLRLDDLLDRRQVPNWCASAHPVRNLKSRAD
jgi:hypothetical protein